MSEQIILPGLVDIHVHLRDPGYTEAEDFNTGTAAALAGGVVAVFDMPNNKSTPTFTLDRLEDKFSAAREKARTDIGFYFGAPPNEELEVGGSEYQQLVELFSEAGDRTFGLKLYCDITTGSEHKHGAEAFRPVVTAWLEANPSGLILAHTEGREATAEMVDLVARQMGGRIHIPHISKQEELEEVIKAKQDPNLTGTVSTGVCPHHLFLTDEDVPNLGWYARMKPSLGTPIDRSFLRANIAEIDVVETDHAPHTLNDKENAQTNNPNGEVGTGKPTCFGVPGLETMLPLLLRGEQEGWITRDQIVEKTSVRPAEMLGVNLQETEVHVDTTPQTFTADDIRSKCEWSPYVGMEVGGKIGRVVINGQTKVLNGEVLAQPGEGLVLLPK
jgi:carbamoyl-phosphate synthase/aspartate carbamoyltransferase/dihydroorotase